MENSLAIRPGDSEEIIAKNRVNYISFESIIIKDSKSYCRVFQEKRVLYFSQVKYNKSIIENF